MAALTSMTVALLLTFSRGAWLGLSLMGVVLYLTIVPRAWLWKGLAIGFLGVVLLWGVVKVVPGPGALVADRVQSMQRPDQEDSVSFRKVCLQTAWAMTREHPWIGFGAGEYEHNIRKYFDETYYAWIAMNKHIHNLYAQILIESGFLGLVGFGVWLVYWLRLPVRGVVVLVPGYTRSLLAACLAGSLAFLLHNHFDVLIAYARGVHLAVLLGLGMAWVRLTSGWLWQKNA
jgi:O-antigen ligase